jgi:hypothetical protein
MSLATIESAVAAALSSGAAQPSPFSVVPDDAAETPRAPRALAPLNLPPEEIPADLDTLDRARGSVAGAIWRTRQRLDEALGQLAESRRRAEAYARQVQALERAERALSAP